ncbi:MAG TPA: sigma-70 family RNA polymerase sigma factor [Actinomycetota bacterium]|nr:sigma-70 family RNA polymerase sigma factor [Actinomycetota bacterium]
MAESEEFLRATLGSIDLVYNIARRMVPRPEDAEDLLQETYLAAFRAWMDHRRPRKVEPWLATICLNLGRSGFRHRARRPLEVGLIEDAPIDPAASSEQAALSAMDREAMHGAMWSLPEQQRIAIALVDLGGFSTSEAARMMDSPRGTVLSRLFRGRRALATLLESEVRERDP